MIGTARNGTLSISHANEDPLANREWRDLVDLPCPARYHGSEAAVPIRSGSKPLMQALYFILAAVHIVALVVTGVMWTIIDVVPGSSLKASFRDIKAVHFGSLHITAWLLGLAYAFDKIGRASCRERV